MKLADNATLEQLLAKMARVAKGDVVRRGILMHTIRHLERGWMSAPREAGKIGIYGFQGTVMDGSRTICADILIAHDAWSGALFTSVVEVNHDSVAAADFIVKICGMFPWDYRPFIEKAFFVSSGLTIDTAALTLGYSDRTKLTKQEAKERIETEWRPDDLGLLAHGDVDTLAKIRRAIMEWQRAHNCQNERNPITQVRGGIASTSRADEAKEAVSDITLPGALSDPHSMRTLTNATDPFTPARRVEIAISSYQRKKGDGEKPLSLEDISKALHTSKVPQGKRRKLEGNGTATSEELTGKALAYMRERYSDSQTDAANKLGVKQQQISKLESRPFSQSRDLMERFTELYGEDIADLEEMRFMEDDLSFIKLMLMKYDRKDAKRERGRADPDIQRLNDLLQAAVIKPDQT